MCAAYLASCGVDATVVDESGYGGNLLGATVANAVRIEVPEASMVAASEHLADYLKQTAPAEPPEPERYVVPVSGSNGTFFNNSVVILIVAEVTAWLGRQWLHPQEPKAVHDFITSQGVIKPLWRLAYMAGDGLQLLTLISCVLCLKRWSIGRSLFTTVLVFELITMIGTPQRTGIPLSHVIGAAEWMLAGIIWFMMYRTPLRHDFDRS